VKIFYVKFYDEKSSYRTFFLLINTSLKFIYRFMEMNCTSKKKDKNVYLVFYVSSSSSRFSSSLSVRRLKSRKMPWKIELPKVTGARGAGYCKYIESKKREARRRAMVVPMSSRPGQTGSETYVMVPGTTRLTAC